MRPGFGIVLAFFGMLGPAIATPLVAPLATSHLIQIQMRCTPSSCIDEQTGVYTQSHCDRYGCRALGGPVGQLGPGGYDEGPMYQPNNSYDRFSCNPNRCIDRSNGVVWESHCDYNGCRPIRPSRNQY